MSPLRLIKLACLLLAAFGLWTCQDHRIDLPTTQRFRLKQVSYAYKGGQVVFTDNYVYDQLNRLSSRTRNSSHPNSSLKSGPGDTIQADREIYIYDAQNRLVRRDYHVDYHLNCCIGTTSFGYRTDITYDELGRSATVQSSEALSDFGNFRPYPTITRYDFGPNGEVIKGTTLSLIDGTTEFSTIYVYANGNVVEEQYATGKAVYEYDNAPNPSSEPSLSAVRLVTGNFSRNNDIKRVSTNQRPNADGTIETIITTSIRTISYNEHGLPIKVFGEEVPASKSSNFFVNTISLSYEAY